MLWNSFEEDSITLTPKVDKDITHTHRHTILAKITDKHNFKVLKKTEF